MKEVTREEFARSMTGLGLTETEEEAIDLYNTITNTDAGFIIVDKAKVEKSLEALQKALDMIPNPKRWLEEDCEDSSRDVPCDNFKEVTDALQKLRELFSAFQGLFSDEKPPLKTETE